MTELAYFDHPLAIIDVVGPDAASFLHNLTTNDVKSMVPGDSRELFLTNHKARVLGHGIVSCLAVDRFRLQTDKSRGEAVFRHLNHYLISEQAELADRTAEFAACLLLGDGADLIDCADVFRRSAFWGTPGTVLLYPISETARVIGLLETRGIPRGADAELEIRRVEAGMPKFGAEMDETRFVVEVDRIPQAISYAKGCYLGQEPIVMARDRGQVNRRLLGLRVAGDNPVSPGTKLMSGDVEVGAVASSVHSARFGCVLCLAYLRRGHQEPGTTLTIAGEGEGDGRAATISSLPFAVV